MPTKRFPWQHYIAFTGEPAGHKSYTYVFYSIVTKHLHVISKASDLPTSSLGPVYTKRKRQRFNNSATLLATIGKYGVPFLEVSMKKIT